MAIVTIARSSAAILVSLTLSACTSPDHETSSSSEAPAAAAKSVAKIRLHDASGTVLLELKPKDGGYGVADGSDHKLGKVRVFEDRVKLKDAAGTELWKVKRKDYGAEVETAAGRRLFRIKLDDGGVYKLRDADDRTVLKCKPKADGFELRDRDGGTVAKVKVRDGKLAIETEDGERLNDIKGMTDARAGMWFAVPGLSLLERAALVVFFLEVAE